MLSGVSCTDVIRQTVVGTVLAMVMAGCAGPSIGDSITPSPVVLAETSAGRLPVSVFLTLGGYDTATRDHALIDLNFAIDGHPVQFVAGEMVICNGTQLKRLLGAFEAQFPIDDIAGKVMTCVYTSGGQTAELSIPVPQKLQILSPRELDSIPHGSKTVVVFKAPPHGSLRVGALSSQMKAFAEPDPETSTQAGLDTSGFQPGSGTISLTEELDRLPVQAPAFRSALGRAQLMTMIQVTWV